MKPASGWLVFVRTRWTPAAMAGKMGLTWTLCLLGAAGCGSEHNPNAPAPTRDVEWVEGAWTQPVPPWGSPVRLNLPVALEDIVLGPSGGLGAFGAHEGGHVEGLNHIWIPIEPGTVVRSWADGRVTRIEDMGPRNGVDGVHEYFVTVDYGRGLVGKHLDVDVPLVAVGAVVKEGDPIGNGPSAELMLIDNQRTDGERTGGTTGSPVSPFDYLREDVKSALLARHLSEVVAPFFERGQAAGNHHPWEPYLTNQMLFHSAHRGTFAGEWILINKDWQNPDPVYFDVMTIFDVTNPYGHFQVFELMDHDWSAPGSKRNRVASWAASDGVGKFVLTFTGGVNWYALYTVDESEGRARLKTEWKQGGYPPAITSDAAVYVERAPIYLGGDADALGL